MHKKIYKKTKNSTLFSYIEKNTRRPPKKFWIKNKANFFRMANARGTREGIPERGSF